MHLRDDEKGQSIQIGAIILFGALVVLLSTYQAFIVPSQNRGVEFSHSQSVQDDMQEVRNAIVSMAGGGDARSVSVKLGTTYPNRALFVNPGPSSGELRTVGTGNRSVNLTIANAKASGDAGAFWNGSTRVYDTGALVYEPNYNVFDDPPKTIYSNTVLYSQFRDGNLTVTGQRLVDGRTLNLVTLNGSLSRSQVGSVSLDVHRLSASETSVPVTSNSPSKNLNITIPTRLRESTWEDLLDEENTTNGGHVAKVSVDNVDNSSFDRLNISLEPGVTYNLRMARVGVGSNLADPDADTNGEYLLKESGNGSVVPEGESVELTVGVRDGYNNPLSGQLVQANTSLSDARVTEVAETDGNGLARLTYTAPSNVNGAGKTDWVNASLTVGPGADGDKFNATTAVNVSFRLTVDNTDGSGTAGSSTGGSYVSQYDETQMNGREGLFCSGNGTCIYNFSSDTSDQSFVLTMNTTPALSGATVDFALNKTDFGTYTTEDGTTDNAGEADATFAANGTGWIASYANSGGSGDRLPVKLTDTSKVISAFDSDTPDDFKYEFVRLYFAEPTNTNGWTLGEEGGELEQLDQEFEGEVYFANDGAAFARTRGVDITKVYNFSSGSRDLNNGGDTIWLNDSTGSVVDKVKYNDNNPDPNDGRVNMDNESTVAVRLNTSGTYPYQDTNNNDDDWTVVLNSTFFGSGGGGGGGGSASQVSDSGGSAISGGTGATFSITNDGGSQVTVTDISVDNPKGSVNYLWEGNTGSGAENYEVFLDGANDEGYLETGESESTSDAYTLGNTVGLTDDLSLDGGNTATVTLYEFGKFTGGGAFDPKSPSGQQTTVVLTFSDTSTKTITFTT